MMIERADRVSFRRLAKGEGAVVLRLDTADYHSLNEVGARIWELLEEPKTLDALVEELGSEITNPPEHLREDIEGFVRDLEARSLLAVSA